MVYPLTPNVSNSIASLCCLWRSNGYLPQFDNNIFTAMPAKPLQTGWLQLPSPPLLRTGAAVPPELPNRVAALLWPSSGFHPPAASVQHGFNIGGYWPPNWRWQPRVLNKKTKRFTKGMVLKYYQEILYPILNGPIGKRLKAAPLQGC